MGSLADHAKRRAEAIAEGRCTAWHCHEQAVEGKRKCQTHLERDRQSQADRRTRLRANGTCVDCGSAPASPSNLSGLCDRCMKRVTAIHEKLLRKAKLKRAFRRGAHIARAKWLRRRLLEGLCGVWGAACNEPVIEGGTACAFHSDPFAIAEKKRKKCQDYNERRRKAGRCRTCNFKMEPDRKGMNECSECVAHHWAMEQERLAARRLADKCRCGADLADDRYDMCPRCRRKGAQRERRARKKKKRAGICMDCPRPAEKGHVICTYHRQKRHEANQRYREKRKRRKQNGIQESGT